MTLLGAAVAVGALVLALVFTFQRRLIYLPFGEVPPVGALLERGEEVRFPTGDGLELRGWFVPAESAPACATFLVFNGNAGNRAFRAPLAEGLAERGFSVLLFDYRGYGGNAGRPDEPGLVEDARSALAYLESRPGVDPACIVYLGESLGTGVAVALAAERPPAALVLRSPFASMTDVASHHYPFLPVRLLLRDRWSSTTRIGGIDRPLLVIVGSADRIVPPESSRRLYDAAVAPGKRWLEIPGADHNDAVLLDGRVMIDAIDAFVRERL